MSDAAGPYGFRPDLERTTTVSHAVRSALCESVARVLDALDAAGIAWRGDFPAWRAALEANPRPAPQLWAVYHDLVQAALGERAEEAGALATELLSRPAEVRGTPGRVATFSPVHLGVDAARCCAVVDNDPGRPLLIEAVPQAEVERTAALMLRVRRLLAEAEPALLDEIDALGHLVILGQGRGANFGGAATVFAWGAVMLNPATAPTAVALAEALAHETAHALLFGMTLGEDLTLNDPAERYSSPLRRDPRPIEGIVHATYVLARMSYAMEALSHLPDLTPSERDDVHGRLAKARESYAEGLGTALRHARLTPAGEAALASCRAYMEEAAAQATAPGLSA